MRRVLLSWSPTAVSHLSDWIRYIARDSVTTAKKERQTLLRVVERLRTMPQSGRIVPEFNHPGLREIIKRPIRIIYRLKNNEVRILALHHSRRQLGLQLFR